MADVFSPEKRSQVMGAVRGRDTRPELRLRSLLHRLGFRFTVNGPRNRKLPGKPDLVLPRFRTVIFVHGCFWHGHPDCRHFRLPATRREWWRAKIETNRRRDSRVLGEIRALGWTPLVVWECALRTIVARESLAREIGGWIDPARAPAPDIARVAEDEAPYLAKPAADPAPQIP